jgi:hypothetical protein
MTVARRFIAGSGSTRGLRPGGTPEYCRSCAQTQGNEREPRLYRVRTVEDDDEEDSDDAKRIQSPAYFRSSLRDHHPKIGRSLLRTSEPEKNGKSIRKKTASFTTLAQLNASAGTVIAQ